MTISFSNNIMHHGVSKQAGNLWRLISCWIKRQPPIQWVPGLFSWR